MISPLSAPVFEVPPGSPSGMRAAADALGAIALGLHDSMYMLSGAAGAVPGWEGAARDAYYAKVNERLEGIHGAQAAVSAAARVASQLATVLDETHRAVYDAQQEAYRLAQQANTMAFPSPTIFWPLESYVRSAGDRLDEAQRAAAAAFLDIFHAAPGYVPPPPPPKTKPKKRGLWSSIGHGVLDVAGLVPVIGEPADLVNASWYAGEGDAVNAALSAASAIPLVGYGASATKAAKYADAAYDATRTADKVRDGGRLADDVAGSGLKGGGVGPTRGPGDGGLGNNSRPPHLGDNGPGTGGGGGGGTGGRPQSRTEYDPNPAGGGRSPEERYRESVANAQAARSADRVRNSHAGQGARQGNWDVKDARYANPVTNSPAWRGAWSDSAAARQRAANRSSFQPGARAAGDANAGQLAGRGFAPHAVRGTVRDFVTKTDEQFVRVTADPKNLVGGWLLRKSDIKGLSPQQIKERFALPELPTHIVDVKVRAGTAVRQSTAGPVSGWGSGGGTQVNLMQRIPESSFTNIRPLV